MEVSSGRPWFGLAAMLTGLSAASAKTHAVTCVIDGATLAIAGLGRVRLFLSKYLVEDRVINRYTMPEDAVREAFGEQSSDLITQIRWSDIQAGFRFGFALASRTGGRAR